MRLVLLFLFFLAVPAIAQEASQWEVEPGSPKRAATIEYEKEETLSYGFSCWRKHWVFFFNHQAPEGGVCATHAGCESEVSDVTLTFRIPSREDFTGRFTLFENYYFQAENLSVLDIEAMVKAGRFSLALDEKLKTIWQRDSLDFTLGGFEGAVKSQEKVFSCDVRAPLPIPLDRPSAQTLDGKVKSKKDLKADKRRKSKMKAKGRHGMKAKAGRSGKNKKARREKRRR